MIDSVQTFKSVISNSRNYAIGLGSSAISTAHILGAALQSNDTATIDAISRLSGSSESLQQSVQEMSKQFSKYEQVEEFSGEGVPSGSIPLTQEAEKIVMSVLSTHGDVRRFIKLLASAEGTAGYTALSNVLSISTLHEVF